MPPKAQCTCKPLSGSGRRPLQALSHSAAPSYRPGSAGGRLPECCLGIAMFILHVDDFCTGCFQFPHLATQVLFGFVGTASGIRSVHSVPPSFSLRGIGQTGCHKCRLHPEASQHHLENLTRLSYNNCQNQKKGGRRWTFGVIPAFAAKK